MAKKKEPELTVEQIAQRRDDAIRRALSTPPQKKRTEPAKQAKVDKKRG